MSRELTVDLDDLLSLVNCAEDFGFGSSMFYGAMRDWAGKVTKKEIRAYAKALAATEGYSEDDGESAEYNLMRWKETYA